MTNKDKIRLLRLKDLRFKSGHSQKSFCAKIGIRQSYFSSIESGKKPFAEKIMHHITNVFNLSSDYFLGEESTSQNVNERIMQLMNILQMSPNSFANELGTSSTVIYNIEKGRNKPSCDLLELISKRFNVDCNWLIHGVESTNVNASIVDNDSSKANLPQLCNSLNDLFVGVSLLVVKLQEKGEEIPFNAHEGLSSLNEAIRLLRNK